MNLPPRSPLEDTMDPSFNSLPPEMKLAVLEYLPFPDKKTGRLVCKEWSGLLGSACEFNFHLNDETVKFVLNTEQKIQLIEAKDLQQPLGISSSRGQMLYSTLELSIHPSVSTGNIRKLLHNCPNIATLELNYLSSQALKASVLMTSFPVSTLNYLTMYFNEFKPFQANVLKELAESAPVLPRLRNVVVTWKYSRLPAGKMLKFFEAYLSVNRFLFKHRATLRYVQLDFSQIQCCGGWYHVSINMDEGMRARYEEIMTAPLQSDLFALLIGFPVHEGENPWDVCSKLVFAQDHLIKAKMDLGSVIMMPRNIGTVLKSLHSKSASSLWTSAIILPQNVNFDCSWVADCNRLIFLSVESYRPVLSIQRLPTNVYQLLLEGKPNLNSAARRWIPSNLKNLQSLRLNLVTTRIYWEQEWEVHADLEQILRMPTLKEFSVTTYSYYNYAGLIVLSRQLGYTYVAHQLQNDRYSNCQYLFLFSR